MKFTKPYAVCGCALALVGAIILPASARPQDGFILIPIPYEVQSDAFDGPQRGAPDDAFSEVPVEYVSELARREAAGYFRPNSMMDDPEEQPSPNPRVVEAFSVVLNGGETPWMRVGFGDYYLGENSFVIIKSLYDEDWQRLDATYMPLWFSTSAIFNGNEVEVTLYVAEGDHGVYVDVAELLVANPEDFAQGMPEPPTGDGVASLCNGTDNKVASSDSRVGRLFFGGCTGWLISNGAGLTAGHCTPLAGAVLEFNVPPSSSNGTPFAGPANDQYPVSTYLFEDDGEGEDYDIFNLSANSNTGLRAHIAQGFFHMTGLTPEEGTTVRVTGYGLDGTPPGTGGPGAPCCDWDGDDNCNFTCNSASLTNQTSTGPCDDCLTGTAIDHEVDTTPANSGSPIIWNSNGLAIGIHTHGGCDDFFSDFDNAGTHLGYNPLENGMQGYQGANTQWVDTALNHSAIFQFGAILFPWDGTANAMATAVNNGQVAIVEGSYPASSGNTFTVGTGDKAVKIIAPVGAVTIGN